MNNKKNLIKKIKQKKAVVGIIGLGYVGLPLALACCKKDFKTIGSMNETSSFWEIFREQASWYSLAGIQRHSWIPFSLMPHYGWHSGHTEDAMYSFEELYKNVEILDTNWNVTHIPEEDGEDQFYMLPTRKEDVIVRHFAGGRAWRKDYFTGEQQ